MTSTVKLYCVCAKFNKLNKKGGKTSQLKKVINLYTLSKLQSRRMQTPFSVHLYNIMCSVVAKAVHLQLFGELLVRLTLETTPSKVLYTPGGFCPI